MPKAAEIAGDILAAATALAGLLLVFIGAVSTVYDTYATDLQASVQPKYRRRAWLGLAGFLLAIAAAIAALAAKWLDSSGWEIAAAILLLCGFAVVVVAALITVLDIN